MIPPLRSFSVVVLCFASAASHARGQGACPPFGGQSFPTGSRPDATFADVDGDGVLDAVIGDSLGNLSVSVARPDGWFQPKSTLALGASIDEIALGDVDGDGDADAVLLLAGPPRLVLVRGDGTGQFGAPELLLSSVATTNRPFVMVDLDGDGDPDIACSTPSGTWILVNDGLGTFLGHSASGGNVVLNQLCAGDFDGDGDADVAGLSYDALQAHSVFVYQNLGGDNFAFFSSFPTNTASALAMADLDGDGRAEYVFVDQLALHVQFSGGPQYSSPAGCCPSSRVVCADIDGDGDVDAVTGGQVGWFVLRNPGNGHLVAEQGPFMSQVTGCALADLDGDGDLDLAVARSDKGVVSLVENEGGNFVIPIAIPVDPNLSIVAKADVDHDGLLDLVVTVDPFGSIQPELRVLLNQGMADIVLGPIVATFTSIPPTAVADLNGDLLSDFLVSGQSALDIYLGTGAGSSTLSQSIPVSSPGYATPAVGDLDGDGDADIVLVGSAFTVLRNNAGTYVPTSSTTINFLGPTCVRLADVDGDGDTDVLAAVAGTSSQERVFLNDGTGNFAPFAPGPMGGEWPEFELADLDGDGDLDLVNTNTFPPTVRIHLNDGQGNFTLTSTIPVRESRAIEIADLDGDGDQDIVAVARFTGLIQVLRNRGNATFEAPSSTDLFTRMSASDSLAIGDFDGDGRPDALVNLDGGLRFVPNTTDCGVGAPFCFGDGSGTGCPCGNASTTGSQQGCVTSVGVGAELRASGNPSIAMDTLLLEAWNLPPNAPVLFFQGTSRVNAGNGVVFGDGLRCTGGTLKRLGTQQALNGIAMHPGAGDLSISQSGATTVGTYDYQTWFRDPTLFCTSATYNLTNGLEVLWH